MALFLEYDIWYSFNSFINLKIEVSFEPIIMIFDFPSTLSLILR